MGAVLLKLWGPFAIHSYGFFILLGLAFFMWFVTADKRFKDLRLESVFYSTVLVGIIGGLFGGRLLFVLSEQEEIRSAVDFLSFWQGGLSLLGGVIGIIFTVSIYLLYLQRPIVLFLDLVAVYAGLLQSIARIGCFFAGCCYGVPCLHAWAVQYTDPESLAPLYVFMHPTQLYSAIVLFLIFLFMYFYASRKSLRPGCLASIYLLLISGERFFVDFWRGDRPMATHFVSYNQMVALGLMVFAGSFFYVLSQKKSYNHLT